MMDGEISSADEEQKNHPDNDQPEQNLNSKRLKEKKSKQANRQFSFTMEDGNKMNKVVGFNLIRQNNEASRQKEQKEESKENLANGSKQNSNQLSNHESQGIINHHSGKNFMINDQDKPI